MTLKFQKTPMLNTYQTSGNGYSAVVMKDYHLYMWHGNGYSAVVMKDYHLYMWTPTLEKSRDMAKIA